MTSALASYPFLTIWLHTGPGQRNVLETEWLGFAGSADFRAAITELLQLAQQHHVTGWVADDRRLGAVRPKDLEWCHSALLVPLAKLGLARFAHLEANDTLNRITINGMYQKDLPGQAYELRHFTLLPEARAWAAS